MADQIPFAKTRIVDYGNGPHVFATNVISTRMEAGGGAVTITFACVDYRGDTLTEEIAPEKEVLTVVGKLTLTRPACLDLMNSINGLLTGIAAHQAKKPEVGAN